MTTKIEWARMLGGAGGIMPIRPENKHRYPSNWPNIRRQILARAGNKCELCGVPNRAAHPKTGSTVVLTIMHIDHTPENCGDDNLLAACQKCHNAYDAQVRANGIRTRRRESIAKTQIDIQPERA